MESAKKEVVKIEKGIPVPVGNRKNKRYPFDEMEVGDSFFIATPPNSLNRIRSTVMACARLHKPKRYMTKAEINETGFRLWRYV